MNVLIRKDSDTGARLSLLSGRIDGYLAWVGVMREKYGLGVVYGRPRLAYVGGFGGAVFRKGVVVPDGWFGVVVDENELWFPCDGGHELFRGPRVLWSEVRSALGLSGGLFPMLELCRCGDFYGVVVPGSFGVLNPDFVVVSDSRYKESLSGCNGVAV